jgi:general secretion pathway protein E
MHLNVLTAAISAGDYVSAWKAAPLVVLLLIWARLLTWVDKDTVAAHMKRIEINSGLMVGLIVAYGLFFYLPNFWIALLVLLVIMGIEVGVYLYLRHQKVGLEDLSEQFHNWVRSLGGKKPEPKAPPGELQFIDRGGQNLYPPEAESPDRPGYEGLQKMLTNPMKRGLERLEIIPGEGAGAIHFWIDGMKYSGGMMERNESAAAITYAKRAAGLDIKERRKPQKGLMKVGVNGQRVDLEVRTAGSATGETMQLLADPRHQHTLKLEELGFSEAQLKTVRDSIIENTGLVLVSAPRGQGRTTLLYGLLRAHDAFLQHIHTIERDPEDDLEGITQNKLTMASTNAEEAQQTSWVISQEPDVILMPELRDARSAAELIKFAAQKRVYVGLTATSTFDAIAQWRKLVGDDKLAMKNLSMVIAGRVVRKLCMACKVGYQPDAGTLRKLNMDPEKVGQLFQARSTPLRDPKGNPLVCEFCHDLHYKGRLGVFEVLVVNDDVRQAILSGEGSGPLKAAFRKQRGRYLQEQALAQVEAGNTSVQEVLRVLRSEGSTKTGPPAAPKPAQSRS